MIISVYVPLIAAVLVGRWFRWRRFLPGHPGLQAWTISVVAVVTALMSTWSLVLLATARIDRVAYVTERLHLVGGLLRRTEHVPIAVSVAAAVFLVVRGYRVGRVLTQAQRARQAADRFRTRHNGALVVVAADDPIAFALAANRHVAGTIVVSTALFTTVPVEQRLAVLAHERAHLTLRHHKHRGAVNLAVALEPWLAPASPVSGWAIERWADEHAAPELHQRRNAAAAIVTFLRLMRSSHDVQSTPSAALRLGGLAYADHDAAGRVEALLDTAPTRRLIHAVPVALVITAIVSASGDATQQLVHLVHAAIR